jgi:hypothetical protein
LRAEAVRDRQENVDAFLSKAWTTILNGLQHHEYYMNLNVSEHYYDVLHGHELIDYELYCYQAWGLVQDIVSHEFDLRPEFDPIIRWVVNHHFEWLSRNPSFFRLKRFWEIVDKFREQPFLIFRHKSLPRKDENIDWDLKCHRI